jgi:hypothetical protein
MHCWHWPDTQRRCPGPGGDGVFNAASSDPAWLHSGDEVHWVAIERARFDELERAAAGGAVRYEAWLDGQGSPT